MKSVWKLICRVVAIVLISLFIGYDAYLFNATYICKQDMPMPLGVGHAIIMSGSMEPAISVMDVVVVRKKRTYEVGDIVTFQSGEVLVTHRIIEKNGDTYVTQGDANNTQDAAIKQDQIYGYVAKILPHLGGVLLFLQKPIGMLFIVLLLLIGMEISFRRMQKDKRKRVALVRSELDELKKELEEAEREKAEEEKRQAEKKQQKKTNLLDSMIKKPETEVVVRIKDGFIPDSVVHMDQTKEKEEADRVRAEEERLRQEAEARKAEEECLRQEEERLRHEKEEQIRREIEEKLQREEEEKRKAEEERIRQEALERLRREEEERLQREKEEQIRREIEEKLRKEEEERIRQEALERLRIEEEERLKREAEEKIRREMEEQRLRREVEEKIRREAEERRKALEEEKIQQEMDRIRRERDGQMSQRIAENIPQAPVSSVKVDLLDQDWEQIETQKRQMIRQKMTKKRKFWILFIIIGILCLFNAIGVVKGAAQNTMKLFGTIICWMPDDSMQPIIEKKDVLILKKAEFYNVGDVIAYADREKMVVHRIIDTNENGIVTKGDSNFDMDSTYILSNVVKGRVVKVNGIRGICIRIWTSPITLILLILCLIGITVWMIQMIYQPSARQEGIHTKG